MLTLDLALVTHRPEGILRVAEMNLPIVDGVRYVVSWQNHGNAPIPSSLLRPDIDIHRFDQTGQSLNRNNALDHCSADIILNADDDLIYEPGAFKAIIKTFEDNPDVDVATFKTQCPKGPIYPDHSCTLGIPLPKGYWVATFDIAFRRRSVGNLCFHPEFGLGSERFHGAEDELFLLAAIRRGLNCRFFPITICEHPGLSTGTNTTMSSEYLRASGCYITLAYPRSFAPRIVLKAWRVSRQGQSGLFQALRYLASGAVAAPSVLRRSRRYLW